METMLRQVGEIAFTALPTFFLVIFLWFYLRRMLFEPIERVFDERYKATEGAKEGAKAALQRAEQKVAEYDATLRSERSKLFVEIEADRKKLRDAQTARVAEAREAVLAKVKAAKDQLSGEAASARATLDAQAGQLAQQITELVLKGAAR